MATKKAYTQEQENRVIEALVDVSSYKEQYDIIGKLEEELGKSRRSITAKASSLAKAGEIEFIKKPTAKTATIAKSAAKDDLVNMLAELLGVDYETLESLTKANKTVITLLLKEINEPIYLEWLAEQELEE